MQIFKKNPIFVLLLGLCPTLAVTTSAYNGFWMGLATTFVLLGSNTIVSLIKKTVPKEIRIPVFITIIASFVTIIKMLLEGFLPAIASTLGIFLPLIVVNCIVLGRAEGFASSHGLFASIKDALIQGIGFLLGLVLIGTIREVLGNGSISFSFSSFNFFLPIFPKTYNPMIIMILAPGAFFVMGLVLAFINTLKKGD